MDSEPERTRTSNDDMDDADPMVLAYRISGPKIKRGLTQVRKSELEKDRGLSAISASALSHGFDLEKTSNLPKESAMRGDAYVERKIRNKLMLADVRDRIEREGITLESLPQNLDIKSMDDPAAHFILELVTNGLKAEGLWRDEDKDLTMSEAFPLSQAKTDPRLGKSDLAALAHGTFLGESDLTHEDQSAESVSNELSARLGLLRPPTLATPMLHNLMRASPRDLYHQIARRMIDSHYFEDHPSDLSLFRCCYMMSLGVNDEKHFDVLMTTALGRKFNHYAFRDFRVEKNRLKRLMGQMLEDFFSANPSMVRALKKRPESDKQDPKKFWYRFYSTWQALTSKQQEALELVYMNQARLSKKAAAKKLGISVDSLISRIKTAVRRFKCEFFELEGVSPKKLPRKMLVGAITHNGLWRYQTATLKSPLFKVVDLKTNFKVEIEWKTLPLSRNLDWKQVPPSKHRSSKTVRYHTFTKPSILMT